MADETKKKAAPKKEAKPEAAAAEKPAKAAEEKPKKAAAAAEPTAEAKPAEGTAPTGPVAGTAPTAAELLGDDLAGKKIVKAKHAKNVAAGVANILATFNNTQVTITD